MAGPNLRRKVRGPLPPPPSLPPGVGGRGGVMEKGRWGTGKKWRRRGEGEEERDGGGGARGRGSLIFLP